MLIALSSAGVATGCFVVTTTEPPTFGAVEGDVDPVAGAVDVVDGGAGEVEVDFAVVAVAGAVVVLVDVGDDVDVDVDAVPVAGVVDTVAGEVDAVDGAPGAGDGGDDAVAVPVVPAEPAGVAGDVPAVVDAAEPVADTVVPLFAFVRGPVGAAPSSRFSRSAENPAPGFFGACATALPLAGVAAAPPSPCSHPSAATTSISRASRDTL